MDKKINDFMLKMKKNSGATRFELQKVESRLDLKFPKPYADFLVEFNGVKGEIGASYLELWSLEEIVTLNQAYKVGEYAPTLVLIGSDGGDTAYAFDKSSNSMPIVETPFIGMGLEETILCGQTFLEFLEYIANNYNG